MPDLFEIRIVLGTESHAIDYDSIDSALHDQGLARLVDDGAVASVWVGELRVTRDLTEWKTLRAQLAKNATTLLRRGT